MRHILLRQDEVVIMDMEAGVEHLGRATADSVDVLIIVVEPGRRSLGDGGTDRTAGGRISASGVSPMLAANCASRPIELSWKPHCRRTGFSGSLSFNNDIRAADLDGRPPYERAPEATAEIVAIRDGLTALVAECASA